MTGRPPPLRDRGSFLRLNGTQFLTVFGDNAFKQGIVLYALAVEGSRGHGASLAQFLFSLPFLAFALYAGDLADRFPKLDVVVTAKLAEVAVMLLGALALAAHSLPLALAVVFLMGTQSAFLGPAKYGALAEYAGRPALARANGWFQAAMMAGILLGTGSTGFLLDGFGPRPEFLPLLLAASAALGVVMALGMRRLPPASPHRRPILAPIRRLRRGLARAGRVPGLRPAILGHALFWAVGSLAFLAWNEAIALRPDGTRLVAAGRGWWSVGLAAQGVFMALGAMVCGRLALRRPLPTWVRLGLGLMVVGFALAGLLPAHPLLVFAGTALASFGSGFYLIPLRTLIQGLAPPTRLGGTLGVSQMLDFVGISGAALARMALRPTALEAQGLFLLVAAALVVAGAPVAQRLARSLNDAGSRGAASPAPGARSPRR